MLSGVSLVRDDLMFSGLVLLNLKIDWTRENQVRIERDARPRWQCRSGTVRRGFAEARFCLDELPIDCRSYDEGNRTGGQRRL